MFARDKLRSGGWHAEIFEIERVESQTVTDTTIEIAWWLSLGGTGQVEYGTTSALGSTTTEETSYLTYHNQNITGLTPGTTYYWRVKSVAEDGRTQYSAIDTVITTGSSVTTAGPRAAPPLPEGPWVKRIGVDTQAIDDSGATDVTAQLQAVLNGLNGGEILVFAQSDPVGYEHGTFVSPGTPVSDYRISSSLNLFNLPDDITLWGYGTRIRTYSNTNDEHIFKLQTANVDRLKIVGFELHGSNISRSRTINIHDFNHEKEHGIGIYRRGTTNAVFEDLWIHHVRGDGISFPGWDRTDWSTVSDNTIRYCKVEDCARQGLNLVVGWNFHVHHCILGNQGIFDIDSEDVSNPVVKAHLSYDIHDNLFEGTGWAGTGINGPPNWASKLIGTTWWGSGGSSPRFATLGPFHFYDNTITGIDCTGLRVPGQTRGGAINSGFWPKRTSSTADYDTITDVKIYGNDFSGLPAAWKTSATNIIIARACDGLFIDDNTAIGTMTIDAPTSGNGANIDVSGSDV